jgi:predicted transcriptional regulator
VKREAMVQSASRSFLDRFFRGAPAAMVLNLVREAKLSESEIEELRRILRDKEK